MNPGIPLLLTAPLFLAAGYRFRVARFLGYALSLTALLVMGFTGFADKASLFFSAVALSVAVPVALYAEGYRAEKGLPRGFIPILDAFAWCMAAAFLSPNLLALVVSWTVAELMGFALITMGVEERGYSRAAGRFLLVSVLTFELSAFTLVFTSVFVMAAAVAGTQDVWRVLTAGFGELAAARGVAPAWTVPLLVIGFVTKMALVPLHFWLPDAHATAPAPASALLSGVMTSMGVYALLRLNQILYMGPELPYALLALGIASIIYGGVQAYVQDDIKRLLAYSTISGTGFSATLLALYMIDPAEQVLNAVLLSVAAHAAYKAALFLDAGVAELYGHTRSISRLSGVSASYPYSAVAAMLSFFSLVGLPPTLGFAAKLYAALAIIGCAAPYAARGAALAALAVSIALSALYGMRYIRIHWVQEESTTPTAPRRLGLQVPELVLGVENVALLAALYPIVAEWLTLMLTALSLPLLPLMVYASLLIVKRGYRVRMGGAGLS